MSLRELATGSDVCTPADDGAGPSNALSTFTNTLLGRLSKAQERLREARPSRSSITVFESHTYVQGLLIHYQDICARLFSADSGVGCSSLVSMDFHPQLLGVRLALRQWKQPPELLQRVRDAASMFPVCSQSQFSPDQRRTSSLPHAEACRAMLIPEALQVS